MIDFEGFKGLTEVVDGVDVVVPETVYDSKRDKTWTAGEHHIEGEEALLYVRQRYGLLRGDFDRVQRQQNFLPTPAVSRSRGPRRDGRRQSR